MASSTSGPSGALASPRVRALARALRRGDTPALSRFWDEVEARGTPLVEPIDGNDPYALVTFIWRGTESTRNVVVLGDLCGWDISENRLRRLPGTDVWHRAYRVRADTRTTYRLGENDPLVPPFRARDPRRVKNRDAGWGPDPLNHHPFPIGRVTVSALELPGAPPQPWVERRPGVSEGVVAKERFASSMLGNERDVFVYTPPGYRADGGPYPLLVLFDGNTYASTVPTPVVLDYLIGERRIPPLVAVLVGNPDQQTRNRELRCHAPFVRFLTEELLPWVRARHRITQGPGEIVVGGSSAGGLAASYAALTRPDMFGAVLSQSGSYWWKPDDDGEYEWLTRQYAATQRLPLRFYMDVGVLESWNHTKEGFPGQLASNRHLRTVLEAKGYPVHYTEFSGGHDYLCWRGTLADGLLALLGGRNATS